uniref:Uncharacterized protein n=1 Tax=Aplanochytrium stocchinoi TaxID=215587 RepID=A0A7S3PTJ9_9STRA
MTQLFRGNNLVNPTTKCADDNPRRRPSSSVRGICTSNQVRVLKGVYRFNGTYIHVIVMLCFGRRLYFACLCDIMSRLHGFKVWSPTLALKLSRFMRSFMK